MALPQSQRDREFLNFDDNGDGTTSRLVKVTGGLGSLLEGITYDYIGATYPSATTEVYTYRLGGSLGTVQATVTVVYTSSSKDTLLSVTRA
jgi:hypothetical protein